MKLMLDTNIVVDILSKREGYKDSLQLLKYCEIGMANGFVSAITVTDVMYILRKHSRPFRPFHQAGHWSKVACSVSTTGKYREMWNAAGAALYG